MRRFARWLRRLGRPYHTCALPSDPMALQRIYNAFWGQVIEHIARKTRNDVERAIYGVQ